ncbi:hypothetical protein SPM88_24785, partial [Enterobacter hormaechei subsp. hoffmannii]
RLVVLVGLAIDQIAQSGLSSLSVIYYSAHLFSHNKHINVFIASIQYYCVKGIPSKSAYACLKLNCPGCSHLVAVGSVLCLIVKESYVITKEIAE